MMTTTEAMGLQPSLTKSDLPRTQPKVLIIGSEDVDARIELMRGLASDFDVAAAGTNPAQAQAFARHGFRYFNYPLGRGLGPCSDAVGFMALWRLLATHRPDIVHAFDTKPGVYGCLAAKLAGVPVVVSTVTGLGSLYASDGRSSVLVRGIYEQLQKLTSRCNNLTIFQNSRDREEFVDRRIVPRLRAALIAGSGVSTQRFDPEQISQSDRQQTRSALGIPDGATVVTMISRIIRSKGVEEYVAAARHVKQRVPGAHFLLVGPADKDSLDSFRQEELTEFSHIVNWPGPRRDIAGVLSASDLFVLPSYYREGIPRVLLEAAAMGLPLVTTDSPGCSDVVVDGVNGLLTPPRDPAALSGAIEKLLGQPDLRHCFGRVSRQRAVELFDIGVVVAKTRLHYLEMLARKKQGCGRLNARLEPASN
jgi:glycosyltransferase involved in cell wall biosynthesis